VVALWSELSSLRARAIKDNCPYIVQFTVGTGNVATYTVYKNDSLDYNITSPNSVVTTNAVGAASGRITVAKPTVVSGTGLPTGVYSTTANITNEWATITKGTQTLTNSIIFEANAIGSISQGTLFIQNTAVKTHGYAIAKASNGHTLKLYKWDGSKWYEM